MIKKMKAAILVNTNKPLVIDQVTMPNKLKLGQVLVKIYIVVFVDLKLAN